MQRRFAGAVLTMLVVGVLAGASAQTTMAAEGRQSYTGTIGGADYRVEVPGRWNGTLVVHNHGYFPPDFGSFGISLTNRPPAGRPRRGCSSTATRWPRRSSRTSGTGYQIENALRDQIALLDWFDQHIGRPRRTIATGQSMGAAIALLLAERNPGRFDGVATLCGVPDPQGEFNAALDMNFAVKTLLADGQDIDLVRPQRPDRDRRGARAGDPAGDDHASRDARGWR